MPLSMKLENRIALVTGGGSGLGRAISLLFAEEGAQVVVNDVRRETAEQTVAQMKGPAGGRAIQADVADVAQVKAMFATVERELGGLDVLVNNAGIGVAPGDDRIGIGRKAETRLLEIVSGQEAQTHLDVTQNLSDESWRRMLGPIGVLVNNASVFENDTVATVSRQGWDEHLAINLRAPFVLSQEFAARLPQDAGGAIINLSSVAALMGLEVAPHYSAAKGAILAFTRAVARDAASRGIRVNAICPGYIDTPMTEPMSPLIKQSVTARTPLGRTGTPNEVAATALFLASDDSSFYTGQWLSPNGGLFIG